MTLFEEFLRDRTTGKTDSSKASALSHVVPEFESQKTLFSLSNKMGKQFLEDFLGLIVTGNKAVYGTLSGGIGLFLSNDLLSTEEVFKCFDGSWVSIADRDIESMVDVFGSRAFIVGLALNNSNTPFTVKESSHILNHVLPPVTEYATLSHSEKQANSVEAQNGQYRAKQGETLGVCNEHRLAPKGMMCSEHHGNMVKTAEMTVSVN